MIKRDSFFKRKPFMAVVCSLTAVITAVIVGCYGINSVFAEKTAGVAAHTVDPTGKGDGYSAVLYGNTNGLPTSEANAIAQTEEGFIWIGSYSGLIRYDGNTFERIDSTTGITSVVSLFVDSENRLWVGTNDSGVAVIDKGDIKMYGKDDGLQSLSIRSITEDGSGRVYIATTHGMVSVNDKLEMIPVDEPQINDEYIRSIKLSYDGVVYGITTGGSVFTVSDGKLTGVYGPEKLGIDNVRSILPDPAENGKIYLATNDGKVYHGELKNSFKNAAYTDTQPLGVINSMCMADNNTLWVCSDSGIGFINEGRFILIKNVPMNTSVEDMLTDYQGNLWFASSQQGVMKIVPNQFSDVFGKYGLESEVVYSTCMLDDMLFVGTKSRGLMILSDGSVLDSYPITSSKTASGEKLDDTDLLKMMDGCKIRSIIRDSKNRLWFSTFGDNGLVRVDGSEAVKFTSADGMPSDRVRTVYERSDGKMIAACTGGLVVIDGDNISQVFGESSGISNTEVLTVTEGFGGEMVLGTDGGGIFVLSDNGVLHLGIESGLRSDVVMRIKKDISRDILWIVTSNSLAYMTSDYKITTVKKFPYSNNFDIYENTKGEMWVLSSNGIYVTDVEQLIKNEEIEPIYYGMDNGLGCIATSNSYSELTADGDLYIAGNTGVAKVNIEKPFENVSLIKMSVPYIEADGEQIYPDKSGAFHISSDVRKLTIYSYVFNYSLMNPDVTYRLDGFESNPTTLRRSELAPINYTNLKGGEYRFVMEIADPQGGGTKSLSIVIIKEKAIYEQIWFRIVGIIGIAAVISGLVLLFVRHRTNKLIKKEKEQRLLVREIVEAFAKVIDMKDKYTNGHSSRVAEYTTILCRELGLDEETIEKYYNIALLHDIGKVGVPPEVLNKQGKLSDKEFAIIKSHSALGYNTLKDISIMPELAIGAGAHHERPDGKGYPKGLKGDEIPRVAQIIAVADTFDAMYSDRPYRKRMNFEKAVSIMKEVRGTQLAADVVDAFLRLVDKGEFRAPDDHGGGSTEDIDNIHRKFNGSKNKEES